MAAIERFFRNPSPSDDPANILCEAPHTRSGTERSGCHGGCCRISAPACGVHGPSGACVTPGAGRRSITTCRCQVRIKAGRDPGSHRSHHGQPEVKTVWGSNAATMRASGSKQAPHRHRHARQPGTVVVHPCGISRTRVAANGAPLRLFILLPHLLKLFGWRLQAGVIDWPRLRSATALKSSNNLTCAPVCRPAQTLDRRTHLSWLIWHRRLSGTRTCPQVLRSHGLYRL